MLGKKIISTNNTPEVILNPEGHITIRGRYMNGVVKDLSVQIEEWLEKYLSNPAEVTHVDFYLEYFSKANSKVFISLLKKIDSLREKNKKYTVNWYYEEGDEDILEKGEYLSEDLKIPFNFIEIFDTEIPETLSTGMTDLQVPNLN